jgi:hypothetical protein
MVMIECTVIGRSMHSRDSKPVLRPSPPRYRPHLRPANQQWQHTDGHGSQAGRSLVILMSCVVGEQVGAPCAGPETRVAFGLLG